MCVKRACKREKGWGLGCSESRKGGSEAEGEQLLMESCYRNSAADFHGQSRF